MKIERTYTKESALYSKEKNLISIKRLTIKHLPVNHHKNQIVHSVYAT